VSIPNTTRASRALPANGKLLFGFAYPGNAGHTMRAIAGAGRKGARRKVSGRGHAAVAPADARTCEAAGARFRRKSGRRHPGGHALARVDWRRTASTRKVASSRFLRAGGLPISASATMSSARRKPSVIIIIIIGKRLPQRSSARPLGSGSVTRRRTFGAYDHFLRPQSVRIVMGAIEPVWSARASG
jgi:hypothetical protein